MGSKRLLDASGSCSPNELVKRSKKFNHSTESSAHELIKKDELAKFKNPDSRLSHLRDLVREIIADPEFDNIESNIATAVSTLNTAFQHKESSQACPKMEDRSHVSVPGSNKEGPPALPPISDDRLERAVFTHPAYGNGQNATYDRLEILGDAYIELIATKMVWRQFPDIPSGRISQIRELLVKNETLANFADMYGFSRRANVPSDYTSQPKRWTKTKGDIFEAYVAAVILSDHVDGYTVADKWLASLWLPKLNELGHQKSVLRSKEQLAKEIMAKGIKLDYIEEQPSLHQKGTGTQTFFIGVYLTGWGWNRKHLGSGQGPSKSAAGDEAAKDALQNTHLISQISSAKKRSLGRA
ncbi:Ribonuclease III [Penicillium argentinense]|uniref:Ribonuclease III n=1 Tax=Penicillium argentinense TaxID=1131581 RepID=A0A9W9F7Z1_9EURO|nr:Ribonuclease III [Penicillium argentinense]KAJ5095170.1 Ribonuclease III [Penicillium argentinense]